MTAEKIIEAFRLLTACIGSAADPSLLGAATAGPGILDSIRKLAASPPPNYVRMADTLAKQASQTLAALPEKPQDADVLYVQMVELSLPDPAGIMADRMDATTITQSMLAKLTAPEYRPMAALFRALTQPALQRLLMDKDFAAGLMPAFMPAVLGGVAELAGKLDDLGSQKRDILLLLAEPFEIERAYALSDAELRQQLELRAEDYRRYRVQIEAIDKRTTGLGALKAAAREAVGRLDFEEVESLLARVDELETESAAETKILRADNALLRGRPAEAFVVLSAAADSFASLDLLEPARRRIYYGERLYAYGIRYGGEGLALSARMFLAALNDTAMKNDLELWAQAQINVGAALHTQGERLGGPKGAALLVEAVAAYRQALRVWTEEMHPVGWANAQNNLGNALATQGMRLGGSEGVALLGEAVAVYCNALRARTETAHSLDWAITQNNRGNALQTKGARVGGFQGAALHDEAVAAYRDALRVLTETTYPVVWANARNNLGTALQTHGAWLGGKEGADLLSEAVAAFRDALRVRTEAMHPVDWAMTQANLGVALQTQGARLDGPDGAALIHEAVAAFCGAMRVWTEAAHPLYWAMATENLGLANEIFADNSECANPRVTLGVAVECLTEVLKVFDPENTPYNHAKATASLARVRAKLASLPDPA